jgi:hypothetical protein
MTQWRHQVREVPDDSNALFGAQRNLKELNVSLDTTGTCNFPVLRGANAIFGWLQHLD